MKRKHILVLWDLTPAQKQLLEGCAPSAQFFYVPEAEVSENDVANANVILGNLPAVFKSRIKPGMAAAKQRRSKRLL